MNLSPPEIRVLGCLLEKQRTTPDAYPLSLNALRLACNQSTNRDPVVQYDDAVLRDALHRLERRGYTRLASGAGSRAPKYRHLLAEALPMGEDEQAVMSVLMLRGPQTPGELKQRTERMHAFAGLGEVHETLHRLIGRELVAALDRRPGQKEERYVQLLGGEEAPASSTAVHGSAAATQAVALPSFSSHLPASQFAHPPSGSSAERPVVPVVGELEERVTRLEREVAQLRAALGDHPEEGGGGRSAGELADRSAGERKEGSEGEREERSEGGLGGRSAGESEDRPEKTEAEDRPGGVPEWR